MTLEEKFEQLMKVNAEKDAQLEYLRRQLKQSMRRNHKELQSSGSSSHSHLVEEEGGESEGNRIGTSEEDEVRGNRRRRGDVYLLGVHFHFFNPTWELRSIRIHACQGSFWALSFEFRNKRHFMEFHLNYKVSFPKGDIKWGSKHLAFQREG